MPTPSHSAPTDRHVHVNLVRDSEGRPLVFTLTLGQETVHLDPGKSWVKADSFKWVTRGLIEAPQSFHVLPGGEVDINGEKVRVTDADGMARLEQEINKHHALAPAQLRVSSPASAPHPGDRSGPAAGSGQIRFHVHLDPLGHLAIEARRGGERVETGLRGLGTLVQQGLMIKPEHVHVDPLQRAIEIDGHRFECSPAGALDLEAFLNGHYAPRLEDQQEHQITVRENAASPTGFDLVFPGLLAGTRVEVKGHFSQEKLDILTDSHKCELIRPGIMLRISPPRLLFRRRRPDGGEEGIPELPDMDYLRSSAASLQQALNHPIVRRGQGPEPASTAGASGTRARLVALKVVRNPQNRVLLWLEFHTAQGGPPEGRAFTHHNVAELQHEGVFKTDLDVALSLDHRKLSILNKQSREERHLELTPASSEAELGEASWMLTEALG